MAKNTSNELINTYIHMKRLLTIMMLLSAVGLAKAQVRFQYEGKSIESGRHALYVNHNMKSNPRKFTFREVREALLYVHNNQKDTQHIDIYIEPSVYWLDNPDENTVRLPQQGDNEPFGVKVKMSNVSLIGLAKNPKDVILASNRGQTQGASGNFTMLHITGDNIHAENITFGNYCNVDLQYPLNPKLSRPKRAEAIVQAQLILCRGKHYTATNCEFISRLNLCPFVGADDVHFQKCYFECTDDALCGTGIYDECRFTLYSSKPFYCTSRQGALFRNCLLHSKVHGTQYLTKVSDPVTMIGCKWTSDDPDLRIEWTKNPNPKHKCLAEGCTLNGKHLDLPPTPDVPMPVGFPYTAIPNQTQIVSGRWTFDAHKPLDTQEFSWGTNEHTPAWATGEGIDGAEGKVGYIQNVRGARMMYTAPENQEYHGQTLTLQLNPCKSKGQGFGSATGQYLDICIKFDTRTLTGYGIRLIRTPKYDNAIDIYLVEYSEGTIRQLTTPERCSLFKSTCTLTLTASANQLTATLQHSSDSQTLRHQLPTLNSFGGIHIQHTGSTGASATVIGGLENKYLEK